MSAPGGYSVLGIDPGTRVTGWGVLAQGEGRPRLVAYGTLRPPGDAPPAARLGRIYEGVRAVVDEHLPDAVSVEEAFAGRNPRSAIRLAEARAVALLAGHLAGCAIEEVSPALVKKTVAGHGRASKETVRTSVLRALGWEEGAALPAYDAADALAVALTALLRLEAPPELRGDLHPRRGRRRRWTLEDVERLSR